MKFTIIGFFRPYFDFLYGAAYNLHQVLEGLGITSSNFVEHDAAGHISTSYWSPNEAMLPLFGMLIIFSLLLLIPLLSMAAYTLSRRKGLLILWVVLCTPGLLSCVGLFPSINYLPVRFVIGGTGNLGSEVGVVPLLILGALFGWAAVVLLYDNLNLSERFRQYYDHLWFPTALIAGVFFVADSGANNNTILLNEATHEYQQSSLYLLSQVRRYQEFCNAHGLSDSISCQWSSYVQKKLSDVVNYNARLIKIFAPSTSVEFYSRLGREITKNNIINIRKEIEEYNQSICPIQQISVGVSKMPAISSTCEIPPSSYCTAFPDGPDGLVDRYIGAQPVALASECIIPSLVAKKPVLAKLSALVAQDKLDKHYRWMYFIVIAVVVGGKIANSSTKIAEIDSHDISERRIVIRFLTLFSQKSIGWGLLISRRGINTVSCIFYLVNRMVRERHADDISK